LYTVQTSYVFSLLILIVPETSPGYAFILVIIDILMFIMAFYPIFYPPLPIQPRENLRTLGAIFLVSFVVLAILQVLVYHSGSYYGEAYAALHQLVRHSSAVFLEILLAIFSYWLTVFERKWVLVTPPTSLVNENTLTPLEIQSQSTTHPVKQPVYEQPYKDVVQPEPVADPHDPLEAPGGFQPPQEANIEGVKGEDELIKEEKKEEEPEAKEPSEDRPPEGINEEESLDT